ncbi:hypothetical protein [Ramlibacter sp. PS4R-6]|uniref:hypothetical protein n=1 Tax=Ramlibacter sp. PS4R-6 TaxID=3133438 RepID=UPI0030B0090B
MGIAEDKLKYLQLQQEADFALWKAREAIAEVKQAYALLAAGKGPGPSKELLEQLAAFEGDAEVKYRTLRDFLRAYFG